ncbi:apolipoprotein N-acyltransferase [Ramlibacter albus]|uniref:Apolipoprotein N-acyltransferase n=1 Tax=Ramlibacter albus TaxID=2079448 RepID=A0A923M3U9_9BURK|nr:apolipoprotein N-acyltransferase [Ramlibacter albus]MBC5763366.1 apolipoprotein N-acyltransferase [Ramlibacter albus]
MNAQGVRRAIPVAALVAGLLHAISIADWWAGQPRWWLQVFSLALLAGMVGRAESVRAAAIRGWAFAIAWLAGTFWWLFISMHVYGGLPSLLAVLAVLALAAFLGLYYAAAAAAFARWARGGKVARALMFACLWLAAELMRASWFTGFPWGASGYAHVDGPLAFLAPWIGVYGIGFVAALVAGGLAFSTEKLGPGKWRTSGWGLLIPVVLLFMPKGAYVPEGPAGKPLTVALLQGNIPQDEKFQGGSGIPVALRWYGEQLRAAKASLVVAPETAIPLLPRHLGGYWEPLVADLSKGDKAAIIGIPLGSLQEGYTNSAVGLKPGGGREYRYDKHHLVPFGEFIPPLFKWFTQMMNIPLGDFNRGAVQQPSFEWQGERLAPNICYEDLFGEDLAERFTDSRAAPTIFVNISNIGWFGDTVAIDQHLQISRMRAIEFARPMIRATNTGATVVIDHAGRVTHSLPRLTRGVLTGTVAGWRDTTPYVEWLSRFGLWPLWLLALGVPVLLARRRP